MPATVTAAQLDTAERVNPSNILAFPTGPRRQLLAHFSAATLSHSLYIITCRTKHDELFKLPDFPEWQAHLSDQGHKKGFLIRVIRVVGHISVNDEYRTKPGILRARAREIAADLIRRTADNFRRTHSR